MMTNEYQFYERIKKPLKYCFDKYFCPKYVGLERLPKKPYILVGNHISNLDISLLICGIKDNINFIISEDLFKNKFLRKILTNMKSIIVKKALYDKLAKNTSILSLIDKEVLGSFLEENQNIKIDEVAMITNVPVVPFGIIGKYGYRSEITLKIGSPLYFDNNINNYKLVQNKVKELIKE